MVERALTYPLKGAGKLRHAFGGALIYFSWVVFPAMLLIGYYIQALVFASTGQEDPPPFGHVVSLSKLGAFGSVITFTYGGFFVAGPMVVIAYIAPAITSPTTGSELSSVIYLFAALTGLFAFGMALLLPVILCQYGRTGQFKSVFNFDELVDLLTTRDVLKAILGTVVLTIGTVAGTAIFATVTFGIGLIFVPFILFWYMLVTAYLYGRAIGTATGTVTTIKYNDLVEAINAQEEGASGSPDGS